MSSLKAIIFLFIITVFLILLGDIIAGHVGIYVAVIIALLTNFVAFFVADQVPLNLFHAKEILADAHPDTHAIMQALTVKAGIPLVRLYLIDSPATNLFAVGKNPRKASIALTKGLLSSLTKEEQTALIARPPPQLRASLYVTKVATAASAEEVAAGGGYSSTARSSRVAGRRLVSKGFVGSVSSSRLRGFNL